MLEEKGVIQAPNTIHHFGSQGSVKGSRDARRICEQWTGGEAWEKIMKCVGAAARHEHLGRHEPGVSVFEWTSNQPSNQWVWVYLIYFSSSRGSKWEVSRKHWRSRLLSFSSVPFFPESCRSEDRGHELGSLASAEFHGGCSPPRREELRFQHHGGAERIGSCTWMRIHWGVRPLEFLAVQWERCRIDLSWRSPCCIPNDPKS